jgi:hypothetical protein
MEQIFVELTLGNVHHLRLIGSDRYQVIGHDCYGMVAVWFSTYTFIGG